MKITSGGQILNNDVIRQAIELLDTSVCITDIHTNILYVNKYFEKQTGYSFEEVAKKNPGMLHSVDIRDHLKKAIDKTKDDGPLWSGEVRIRRKDGTTLWVNSTISPVRDEQGDIQFFVMVEHDITEQKKMLVTAREQENLLNDIALLSKTELIPLYWKESHGLWECS